MSLPTTQAIHATFSIERHYPHAPSKVFRAFADHGSKRRWFAEGEGFTCEEFTMDFREGGKEIARFTAPDGSPGRNDTVYLDIVPDERLVIAYTMMYNGARISCSMLTITLSGAGSGTTLTLTEQGLYFPNSDGPVGREAGTRELLNALALELDAH